MLSNYKALNTRLEDLKKEGYNPVTLLDMINNEDFESCVMAYGIITEGLEDIEHDLVMEEIFKLWLSKKRHEYVELVNKISPTQIFKTRR